MSTTIITRSGRTESAKILLKRGAQLQAKDLKGLTALHHAARNYQVSWIELSALIRTEIMPIILCPDWSLVSIMLLSDW